MRNRPLLLLKRVLSLVLVIATLWPTLSRSQATTSAEANLDSLLDNGLVTLNEADKALLAKDPTGFDYRLATTILPYLASPEGGDLGDLQVGRLRWGYDTEVTQQTRKTASTNISPHFYGKAASITAIGTTYCGRSSLYPQNIDVAQPIWTNWQTGDQDNYTKRWPFGIGFDRVSSEMFWDQAKSFTHRPVAPESWSEFLQLIAKGEIEDRLNLKPGDLQGIAIDDFSDGLAELRLARTLGIASLPKVTSEDQFYEQLGRRALEDELALPRYSLAAQPTWRELYQQIAITTLERELNLTPTQDEQNNIVFDDQLIQSTRYENLNNALRARATYYQDPVLGLGLPSNEYLPADSGLSIFERVAIGDPDGLAITGAYFLAQYLELSGNDTKQFIAQLNNSTDDLPVIMRSARPINPELDAEDLFTTDIKEQVPLYEQMGRKQEQTIRENIARLDEGALLAISDSNKTPSFSTVMSVLTDTSKRDSAISTMKQSIANEANYITLDAEALIERGRLLFARGLDLPLDQLKQAEEDQDVRRTIGSEIDGLMGWPSEQRVAEGFLAATKSETANSIKRDIRNIGASLLWQRSGLPNNLSTALTSFYFNGFVSETVDTSLPTPTDEGVIDQPEEEEEEIIEDVDETDEFIQAAIPVPAQTLSEAVSEVTGVPANELYYIFTGQMRLGLFQTTLGTLGRYLINESTTITPTDLITAADQPSAESVEKIARLTPETELVDEAFFTGMEEAVTKNNVYDMWQQIENEAIHQWNFDCEHKQELAKGAINKLMSATLNLPDLYSAGGAAVTTQAGMPLQILVPNKDALSSEVKTLIKEKYPNADGIVMKWGVYTAPRGQYQVDLGV